MKICTNEMGESMDTCKPVVHPSSHSRQHSWEIWPPMTDTQAKLVDLYMHIGTLDSSAGYYTLYTYIDAVKIVCIFHSKGGFTIKRKHTTQLDE